MDLTVRPQHQMVWGEDFGPETDVDNPELPRDGRPESGQGDVVYASSDSDDDEWKYVKGATKPEVKQQSCIRDDNKSLLNPNATEFVPGLPSVEKDEFIAASPNCHKASHLGKNLDDIDVPTETEFEKDISSRACDLEPATNIDLFNVSSSVELNSSVEPSRVGEVGGSVLSDTNESDGVSLFLTPQKDEKMLNEISQKLESTNPFSCEDESKPHSDQVDLVHDYFGKNELDFKPFESVATHHVATVKDSETDKPLDSNSVVDQTSPFTFTESHMACNDIARTDESEKERNQLEIKEPESPVNSEGYSSGLIEHNNIEQQVQSVDKSQDFELNSFNIVVMNSEKTCSPGNAQDLKELIIDLSNDSITDTHNKEVSVVTQDTSAEMKGDNNMVVKEEFHLIPCDVEFQKTVSQETNTLRIVDKNIKTSELIEDFEESILQDTPKTDQLKHKDNDECLVSHEDISPTEMSDDEDRVINHVEHLESCVYNVNSTVEDNKDNIIRKGIEESQHLTCNLIEEEINSISQGSKNTSDRSSENVEYHHGTEMELADTIGPNAFSFSQPYEESAHTKVTPIDFLSFRKNDIMTTSMHECLENNSSFEFIGEGYNKELPVNYDNINRENITNLYKPDVISEPSIENKTIITFNKLEDNEVPELKPVSGLISTLEPNKSAIETESVIIKSHEVPVSSEPDFVFVEQIYPTVEVSSEEASPVSKENLNFDVTSAVSAAGITTALGVGAVISSVSNKKESGAEKEDAESSEGKTTNKSLPSKSAAMKKPTPTTTKPPVLKTSTSKTATAKSLPLSAKPKAPLTNKSAPLAVSKAKPLTSTTKASTAPVAKSGTVPKPSAKPAAPLNKTIVKTSVPSAPKPTVGSIKATTKTSAATSRSTTLTAKTATTAKTLSSFPKAPIAAKKSTSTSAKPLVGTRPSSAIDSKTAAKLPSKTATSLATKPSVPRTTGTVGTKAPTKLISAVTANKLKTASSKPAPIKAKSPLSAPKRPTSAPNKKISTVLDKNAKNTEKSVPKEIAQKEITVAEGAAGEESLSSTTNGHHIENGNVTPLEEIASHII